jgi:hypothetical protein
VLVYAIDILVSSRDDFVNNRALARQDSPLYDFLAEEKRTYRHMLILYPSWK